MMDDDDDDGEDGGDDDHGIMASWPNGMGVTKMITLKNGDDDADADYADDDAHMATTLMNRNRRVVVIRIVAMVIEDADAIHDNGNEDDCDGDYDAMTSNGLVITILTNVMMVTMMMQMMTNMTTTTTTTTLMKMRIMMMLVILYTLNIYLVQYCHTTTTNNTTCLCMISATVAGTVRAVGSCVLLTTMLKVLCTWDGLYWLSQMWMASAVDITWHPPPA